MLIPNYNYRSVKEQVQAFGNSKNILEDERSSELA